MKLLLSFPVGRRLGSGAGGLAAL